MEANITQGLTVYALLVAHQRRIRTYNAIERANQALKRSTRVSALFPKERSILRLFSALLCEQSTEWRTGKIYLNMNPQALTAISCGIQRCDCAVARLRSVAMMAAFFHHATRPVAQISRNQLRC